jgi:hypothetical protein
LFYYLGFHRFRLFQKMDMGPCPKVHSLQLRKEYPSRSSYNILSSIVAFYCYYYCVFGF